LAIGSAAEPFRNVFRLLVKVFRTRAISERKTLSTLAGDIPVAVLMPSQVVLEPAVALQSKMSANFGFL
jgi:hypothetical protein